MARKDLLQAFRELEAKRRGGAPDAASPAAAPTQPTSPGPASPGLTSPSSTSPGSTRPGPTLPGVAAGAPAAAGAPGAGAALFRPLTHPVVLAALVLVFALGFFAGRRGLSEAVAGGSSTGGGEEARALGDASPTGTAGAPTAGADAPEAEADRALYDRANRYTVLAITYDTNSERNRELASATVAAFRALGLPAARPQPSGSALVVVVGAAPTQEGLAALRDDVRLAAGPNGRPGEFSTAGIYPIDNLIER